MRLSEAHGTERQSLTPRGGKGRLDFRQGLEVDGSSIRFSPGVISAAFQGNTPLCTFGVANWMQAQDLMPATAHIYIYIYDIYIYIYILFFGVELGLIPSLAKCRLDPHGNGTA